MQKNISQQVDELLAKVMTMETQQAFDYMSSIDLDAEVVNRVAMILKPSETRTVFLEERGLVDWLVNDINTDEDLSGQSIANIRIDEIIGKGGMGTVYKGTDLLLKRTIAVKTLQSKHKIHDRQAHDRFRQEALLLSKIDHANICRIHSLIETENSDFLVLEYIVGRTLTQSEFHQMSKTTQLNILKQILKGLQAAHQKNIIHRDIKPDNIMISDKGIVKILDFGISRLSDEKVIVKNNEEIVNKDQSKTVTGSVMGTLSFMSPEQAAGENITTATDIYSFGLVVQTLLSQVSVYPRTNSAEQLLKLSHKGATQVPVDLPRHWVKFIQSLKAIAPSDRPTAKEALAQLEKIIEKPKKRMQRLAMLLVLVLITFFTGKYITDLKHERQQAELAKHKSEQVVKFLSSMFQKANPYAANGQVFSAEDLLNQGLERIDDELQDQIEIKAYLKAIIGDSYMLLGNVELADKTIEQAQQDILNLSDIDPETLLIIKETKVNFLMNTAKYSEAEAMIDAVQRSNILNKKSDITRFELKKVMLLNEFGKLQEAIQLSLKVLKEIEKEGDLFDQYRVNLYNQLGISHFYQGQIEQGKIYLEKGVELIEQSTKSFNDVEMQILDALSSAYLLLGDNKKSLEIALKTISVAEELLPENHIDLARIYNNMSLKYFYIKNYQQAKLWNDKSLNVFTTNFESGQLTDEQVIPLYASTLIAQANILSETNQLVQALEILTVAKTYILKIFPELSMEYANVEFEIALVRWEIDESDELATFHLTKSLDIFSKIKQDYVGKHLTAQELKIVMQKRKDLTKAKILFSDLLKQLELQDGSELDIKRLREKFSELL